MKHFLSIHDFSDHELKKFIDHDILRMESYISQKLTDNMMFDKIMTNLFYQPSTRTSASFQAAMYKLGGKVLSFNEVSYSSVAKGEDLEDTLNTLKQYSDLIVLRHSDIESTNIARKIKDVSIINAGNGTGEHPTQALLDLYTIQKECKKEAPTITFFGDLRYSRTVHSLLDITDKYYDGKCKRNFVSNVEFQINPNYVRQGDLVTNTLTKNIFDNTDVLYVTRLQKEYITNNTQMEYTITPELMNKFNENMILMHPFPRVWEIDKEVDNDPRAKYFDQIKNGLLVRMTLINKLLV